MPTNRSRRIVAWGVLAVALVAGCVPAKRPEPLAVSTDLPFARVGETYSHTFAVTGGVEPYTFDLIGLPGGLSFDVTTGTISGTPGVAYPGYTLELTVTDSGTPPQQVVEFLTLEVKPLAIRITTDALPDGRVGAPYTASLTSEGGQPPLRWAVTAGVLPPPDDFRLDLETGVISGIPEAAGTWTFEVTVTDSGEPPTSDSRTLSIEVVE